MEGENIGVEGERMEWMGKVEEREGGEKERGFRGRSGDHRLPSVPFGNG